MAKTRSNVNTVQSEMRSMFVDQRQTAAAGYTNLEGGSEGVTGDGEAPWLKNPPFVTEPVPLVQGQVVPVTGGANQYLALESLQCRQYRLVQVYLTYTMAVGGQLSIIPELFAQGQWYVQALVSATVTPFNPAGARFPAGGFGSRPLLGSELRTAVLLTGVARFTLTFEVSGADELRLNVLDLTANAGNTLDVVYALSL